MEVYIDDMLVKSVKVELHVAHLVKLFQVKNYNMKLNPTKCAFGVSIGKFLGFIVNSRGIEENPDKIKAMLDIQPPSNTKEIQRFTGRIAALSPTYSGTTHQSYSTPKNSWSEHQRNTRAQPTKTTQLAPDLLIWRLSVNGAANSQGSGAGLILTSPDRINVEHALRFGFQASNNEVEYEVVIAGLNLAHSMEADQLEICSDSQLVVRQIEDSYEARCEKMILYLKKVRELFKKFIRVQVRHVLRAENLRADALAKLAIASREDLDRLVPIEHLQEPSVNVNNEEVSPVMSEPSWIDPIWDYLVDRILPSDPKEASKLRTRSARFTIHRGTLYKRGFSTPILKCVGKEDTNYVLREVHEGIYGNQGSKYR